MAQKLRTPAPAAAKSSPAPDPARSFDQMHAAGFVDAAMLLSGAGGALAISLPALGFTSLEYFADGAGISRGAVFVAAGHGNDYPLTADTCALLAEVFAKMAAVLGEPA